jgi:hypothetical protein
LLSPPHGSQLEQRFLRGNKVTSGSAIAVGTFDIVETKHKGSVALPRRINIHLSLLLGKQRA